MTRKQQIKQLKKIFNKSKIQKIRIWINSKFNNSISLNNITFILYSHDHIIIQLDKIYNYKTYKFYYNNIYTEIKNPIAFLCYENK